MIRVDILLYSQYEGKALWILPLSIMLMMCFFFLFFFIFFFKDALYQVEEDPSTSNLLGFFKILEWMLYFVIYLCLS